MHHTYPIKHRFIIYFYKAFKDKRIYVNTQISNEELELSTPLKYTAQEDHIKTTKGGEKEDSDEEILTPGNLIAFAWHVSQGMVREFTCPFREAR